MRKNSLKNQKNNEILILACLKRNEKEQRKYTGQPRRTLFPITAIYKRLKEQENKAVIKCATSIDFREIGHAVKIKIPPKTVNGQLLRFFQNSPNTTSVCQVKNGASHDAIVEMSFEDKNTFNLFLRTLETDYSIKDRKHFTITEDIRREGFLYKE